jgi:hypothetical protein
MKANASVFCLLFTLALATGARAEDPPTPDVTPTINPQVVDKLIDMGNHLRGLPTFQVDAEVSRDIVLESGQKIKTEASTVLKVVGRDRMYAKTEGDVRTREFFYNGKKLTQYSPFLKYYTTVDAPPEISEIGRMPATQSTLEIGRMLATQSTLKIGPIPQTRSATEPTSITAPVTSTSTTAATWTST